MLVLSLFPGIGLLDMAFEEEGFCVVRGPDVHWGGDVRRFHPPPGRFDGVIGGPPCQAFTPLRHMSPHVDAYGNLIPEFERVVLEAQPGWFLMENVREAPMPVCPGYVVHDVVLRDHWCGGETSRVRRFSFGHPAGVKIHPVTEALHTLQPKQGVTAAHGGERGPRFRRGRGAVALHEGRQTREWRKPSFGEGGRRA
jgi:DNA (cytosine-5)-methyltransferase 1